MFEESNKHIILAFAAITAIIWFIRLHNSIGY